jgi:hypothetical protein
MGGRVVIGSLQDMLKKLQMVVFWVVTPCSDVVGCQCFKDLAAFIFSIDL